MIRDYMNDTGPWRTFMYRIQAVAANRAVEVQSSNPAVIDLKLFIVNGTLVSWCRPDRTPLEPKDINFESLGLELADDWDQVISHLKGISQGLPIIKRLVVTCQGKPVGWLNGID